MQNTVKITLNYDKNFYLIFHKPYYIGANVNNQCDMSAQVPTTDWMCHYVTMSLMLRLTHTLTVTDRN